MTAERSDRGARGPSATAGARGPLVLSGVSKRFGDFQALDALDVTLDPGESLVLLGPSGCGKTTTLRLIAGFERPNGGTIELDGRQLAGPGAFVPPEQRNMAVVFQSYALWPHMTVAENVGFGPRLHARKRAVAPQVRDALASVQLPDLGHRYPHELSGGQQQRVALARALITRPRVLLLDEPLSNLDTQLREEMRIEIRRLHRELDQTMVYVTHDQAEALSLADRVAVMRHGVIEQLGPPRDLYRRPRNGFVARALGATSVITGELHAVHGDGTGDVTVLGNLVRMPVPRNARRGGIDVSLRPGGIHPGAPGRHAVAAVTEAMFLGETTDYSLRCIASGETLRATVAGPAALQPGDEVSIEVGAGSACALEQGSTATAHDPVGDLDPTLNDLQSSTLTRRPA